MEATLNSLAGLLLKAIPTVILLVFTFIYLRYMFFGPLEAVLRKRREATAGAREAAAASLKIATEQAAKYEAALREARKGIYKELDETRRGWIAEQSARLEEAKHRTRVRVLEMKVQIDSEIGAAHQELALNSESLADQIADSLLERKAG
jgi:F-type H+-transporting ATPase subunit b